MSKLFEITLPKLGESIHEATIVAWLKKPGEHVALDEPLLEVATDKVNSEIPSPEAGILSEIIANVDEKVEVGAVLAKLSLGEGAASKELKKSPETKVEKAKLEEVETKSRFFSPAVMKLAENKGIPLSVLDNIEGTGAGGRVSKKDLEAYLNAQSPVKSEAPKECFLGHNNNLKEELIPMSGMRKAIAENMVKSFYQAPHASLVTEVDMTDIMHYIKKEKEDFHSKMKAKLTITSFVINALASAAKQFPLMNSSIKGDNQILVKHYVNIGIAVSIDQGLVVPVLKGCHHLNFSGLAKGVADLSKRARTGRLFPQDVQDGTMTLTNFGMSGTLIGTPILRYPEVAIIGMGAIQKRVVVLDDNSFGVRSMLYMTLTFDHRVIDGMYGCSFLNAVKLNLENYSLDSIYKDS